MTFMQNDCVLLSSLGLLKISGVGAKKLLQGQLTCNLDDVSAATPQFAAHCNPQGRIISLFWLLQYGDDYYLQMPRTLIPTAMTALKKYAVFFKVTLSDVSDAFIQYGHVGDHLPTNAPILSITMQGTPARQILIYETPALTPTRDEESWHYLQIINCLPMIYPETVEAFLPHELNLQNLNAISFNKGCYTGQEIIARMHYRGKLKTTLVAAEVDTPEMPIRGADIYSETGTIGHIVDFCKTGANTYTLLTIINPCSALFLDAERQINIRLI